MKKLLFILIIIAFFTKLNVKAQNPPCQQGFPGFTYSIVEDTRFAQLRTDMPLDVMIGYIAWDSVCRYGDYNEFLRFFERQTTFNDTIKTLMKYYYEIVDFDPIISSKNSWYIHDSVNIPPYDLIHELIKKVRKLSPNPLLDNAILASEYIFRIRAVSVNLVNNPRSADGRDITNVEAEILDTIKGKIIPDINLQGTLIKNGTSTINNAVSIPGAHIKFWYCPQWGKGDIYKGPPLVDSLGNSWIKEGEEYIVFLQSVITCNDSINVYYTIYPIGLNTQTYTMYPIKENGEVFNPGNEFGFGTNTYYQEFISMLRNRIYQIKNY